MLWLLLWAGLSVVVLAVYSKLKSPRKAVKNGEVLDHYTLNNALRKQEGKPPLLSIVPKKE